MCLFGALITASPATSGDHYIACLQRQLDALGANPGPADGVLGPRTHAAAKSISPEPSLPALSVETAIHWCRDLPTLRGSGLDRFRPSSTAPLIAVQPSSDPGRIEPMLRTALADIRQFVAQKAGNVEGAARIGLVGGSDPAWLANALRKMDRKLGVGRINHNATVAQNCSDGERFGGSTVANLMVVCWPTHAPPDPDKTILPLVAHEYTHIIQAELSGILTGANRSADGRRVLGPDWLVEGNAEAIMFDFMAGRKGWSAPTLFGMQSPARAIKTTLFQLRPYGSVATEETYHVAHFAVHLLIERHGLRAVFDYWRRLGDGESWETAFKGVFGTELRDYETTFDQLRRNLGAAMRYSTPEEI